jgi:hypothetical protein
MGYFTSTVVFFAVSTECLPDVIYRYSFASVMTIPVAAVTIGIKKSFYLPHSLNLFTTTTTTTTTTNNNNNVLCSKMSMSTAYISNQIVTSKYPSETIMCICRTGSMEDLCVETAAGGGLAKRLR